MPRYTKPILLILSLLVLLSGAVFSASAAQQPCTLDMEPIVNALSHARDAAANGELSDMQVFLEGAQTALDDLRVACETASPTPSTTGEVTIIEDSGLELGLIFTGEDDAYTIHYPDDWDAVAQSFSNGGQQATGANFGPQVDPNPLPNNIEAISFAIGEPLAVGRFIGLMDMDQLETLPFEGLNTFEQLLSAFEPPSNEITVNNRVVDRIRINDLDGVRVSLDLGFSEQTLSAIIYILELTPGEVYGAFGVISYPEDTAARIEVLNAMLYTFEMQSGK
ncbi:MAG: hypothetical protein U0670_17625 [Anaerolineae bacterium]